jgi:uncharacterized integral membrane protein
MEESAQIPKSFVLLYLAIVVICVGAWLLFWRSTWPPSPLQIGAAIIGALIACVYCVDRSRNWDVRAWDWRQEQRRNRAYSPFLYRILPFSGAVGVIAALIIDSTFGKAVGQAFIPLAGAGVGLIFAWHTIEAIRHIVYFGARK